MKVRHVSLLSSLVGIACALGGSTLTLVISLAHQVSIVKRAGNCLDCSDVVTLQLGYPLPWLWYSASTDLGGPILSSPRLDLWAFAANFSMYTLLLLGLVLADVGFVRASNLTVRYLERKGYLERFVMDVLLVMAILIFFFMFWWPLIF